MQVGVTHSFEGGIDQDHQVAESFGALSQALDIEEALRKDLSQSGVNHRPTETMTDGDQLGLPDSYNFV